MSTRNLLTSFLAVFVLLMLTTSLALAWPDQPPDFATISGPGLVGSVKITNPDQLAALKLGALEDFDQGALAEPPQVTGEGYQITRYFDGGSFNFASLRYYPDAAGGVGYLYFEDGPDLSGDHTPYHRHWLRARPEGEAALRQVLTQIGAPVESPATSPVAFISRLPVTLVAVLGGVLAFVWIGLRKLLRRRTVGPRAG